MATTWIIAADAGRARVLQVAGRERLLEIEDMLNPAARLQNQDINTDASGRFRGQDRARGHSDGDVQHAVDHYDELFAKRVGEFLDKARNEHRFDRLVLVAPPRFLGMMRKKLGKELERLVVEDLDKDLSWLRTRDLEQYFRSA